MFDWLHCIGSDIALVICKEIGNGPIKLRGGRFLCRSAVYIAPFVDLSVSGLLQIRLFGRMAH